MNDQDYMPTDWLGVNLSPGEWVFRPVRSGCKCIFTLSKILEVSRERRKVLIQTAQFHGKTIRFCEPGWASNTDQMLLIASCLVPSEVKNAFDKSQINPT